MPLLCFAWFRSQSAPVLDNDDVHTGSPRLQADKPPPLSPTATNLFDTFPRVVYGGYRRYYETSCLRQEYRVEYSIRRRSDRFEPALGSIGEDPWSWQNLPTFTGRRSQRKVRRTNSSLRSTRPRLRKKPRFRASAGPLVDATYPWPDWLLLPPDSSSDSESSSDSSLGPTDEKEADS
ncbi:hypothetical protein C8R44DRAFT_747619 [Mycena epipterygia]|nr:hypothetical protein C8R44DRAFT_747619 [Mycena epipterygia]